jgi:membrane-associated phospholipid phosphatase
MLFRQRHKLWYLVSLLVVWGLLILCRPLWFHAWCATTPTPCTPDSVNAFDQMAFRFNLIRADFLSNVLQNAIGALLFLFPWILYRKNKFSEFEGPAWRETFTALELTFWNLVTLEVVRALVQRPRPLVFHDPMGDGSHISQYNSFYSGHTSFVALATLHLYFMMKRRFPEARWIQIDFFMVYLSVCILMASLRVIGGRHYPTDTLGGFVIGTAITLIFNSKPLRTLRT